MGQLADEPEEVVEELDVDEDDEESLVEPPEPAGALVEPEEVDEELDEEPVLDRLSVR